MVNRNLIREFDVSDEDWNEAIGDALPDDMGWLKGGDVGPNQIVEGKVLRIDDDFILVDVGYKSEGIIPRNEWEEGDAIPEVGETIRVLVEDTEDIAPGRQDDRGMIVLSKRKAEKIEKWMKVMETVHENDVVSGLVTRKIKGGLLVDIGVNVFLPASQVDIRRPHDIGEYIGKEIKCLVLKIDEARRNIVVSRRSLIEAERAQKKSELLKQLEVGQLRKGVVKNIADFGAFVDLGGIDGLVHISEMSWTKRISHPSELVHIDQEVEVMILDINQEKQEISLGMKQTQSNPWDKVADRYPPGAMVKGRVRNLTNYGAFIEIEEGIDGLLHVSDMSWTRKIGHPSEVVENPEDVVKVGDDIEVKILRVDAEERKIGLSRKRVEWGEEETLAAENAAEANGGAGSVELKGGIGSESGPLFKPAAPAKQSA